MMIKLYWVVEPPRKMELQADIPKLSGLIGQKESNYGNDHFRCN